MNSEFCATCSKPLSWIEISFGRFNDPVCGRCLMKRREAEILDGLTSIVQARRSIRLVEADPTIRQAVEAVCAAAGCTW